MRSLRFASRVFALLFGVALVVYPHALRAQILSAPTGQNSTLAAAVSRARTIVQKEFAPKVPGLSVAVAVDGKMVWSEGFGYADLAQKKPVSPSTRFRIGSISKPLAAAGLMLLVERGRLDLDAPVQTYVPDFPDKGAPITTRLLAGHLSGIRHYRGREIFSNRPYASVRAGLEIFAHDPLEAPPGTKYIYSTYGWSVIGAVMEAAAGEEFTAYLDASVIRPLGLTHTRPDRAGIADADRTQFYESDSAGRFVTAPAVDSSYKWAGGGYLSTPEDLVRFGSAHLQPGFLKKETLAQLFTSQKTSAGKPTHYGLGWSLLTDAHGHQLFLHTGGSVGGTSVLLLHPDSKTVVALVCNHGKSPFTKEAREAIVELFAPFYAQGTRAP